MSIRNRRAGHNYERQLAEEYRELGYIDCTTSRYSSRKKDDFGIDLDCTIPFCVQAKYYKNQPNFSQVLDDMRVLSDEIKLVHFKRNKGKGQKKDELVILKKEDWYTIVQWLKEAKIV